MRFGTRSLFVLTTVVAVMFGLGTAFPPLILPLFMLVLAASLAALVIGFTTLTFFIVDRINDGLAVRRGRRYQNQESAGGSEARV